MSVHHKHSDQTLFSSVPVDDFFLGVLPWTKRELSGHEYDRQRNQRLKGGSDGTVLALTSRLKDLLDFAGASSIPFLKTE